MGEGNASKGENGPSFAKNLCSLTENPGSMLSKKIEGTIALEFIVFVQRMEACDDKTILRELVVDNLHTRFLLLKQL